MLVCVYLGVFVYVYTQVDLKALGLPDDDSGRETLKKYCEPEDVELPFLSGKKVTAHGV